MKVLRYINTYSAESDHAPMVCVVGHWVAQGYSQWLITCITGVCVLTSYKVKTLLWLMWFLWLPSLPQFTRVSH